MNTSYRAAISTATRMLSVACTLLLVGCSERKVFSSRSSPDASLVAESIMIGGETGQIAIRAANSWQIGHVDFGETVPDVFFRWIDNQHLELWKVEPNPYTGATYQIGDVHLTWHTYPLTRDFGDAYRRSELNLQTFAIPAENVQAAFSERSTRGIGECVLDLSLSPNPHYAHAEAQIASSFSPSCKERKSCTLGFWTQFSLDIEKTEPQTMLTSATVSDIPSYNRLAVGADGTSIRGQFLAESAIALLRALRGESISLDFSEKVFEKVVRYEVPLSNVKTSIEAFEACLGRAGEQ